MTTRRRAPESVAPRIAALLLACLALLAVGPVAASAHAPMVSATCSTLSINLQYYQSSPDAPTPNSATIAIDGAVVSTVPFGQWLTMELDLGDPAAAHTWSVAIDAVDPAYDTTVYGSSSPCAPVPQRDAAAAIELSPPTCMEGQSVQLGVTAFASWGELELVDGTFRVTATAETGHLFDDGEPTRTFTGVLGGPVPSSAAECAPPPVVATQDVSSTDCATSMVETVTTTTTTGWVYDDATSGWVAGTPTVVRSSAFRPAPADECPATPPQTDPGSGNEAPPAEPQPTVASEAFFVASAGGASPAAQPRLLAHNGVDPAAPLLSSLGLLCAGLVLYRRSRGSVA